MPSLNSYNADSDGSVLKTFRYCSVILKTLKYKKTQFYRLTLVQRRELRFT